MQYDVHMRTTISLDDRLSARVKRQARASGLSVSAFIAKVLDDALKRPVAEAAPPFRLIVAGAGGAPSVADLDRPRQLDVDDDEAAFHQARKSV